MFELPVPLDKITNSPYVGVFDLLHTGIAILSAEGKFLFANKAFKDMFNLPKDLSGTHVSDFFLTAEQGVLKTIRTKEMTINSSITFDNAKGVSFRYPLLDKNKELVGVIVESISSDIGKDKLLTLLETVRQLEEKADYFERERQKKKGALYTFDSIIGASTAMQNMKKLSLKFAAKKEPILICGESGTGKELVAQALHSASSRDGKPFLVVNCAALPPDLMESELFGYAPGSFTGAKSGGMKGKFELANTGTIFLDEIGELPLPMQAKLLRVLESGEIQKLGYPTHLHSDFRLIAATNKQLSQLLRGGQFREDLYHRLSILELNIPPLRERRSDIPLLVRHFIETSLGPKRARDIQISNELYRMFSTYPWHGNIRELRNVLIFALYALEDDENILTIRHLPERFFTELSNSDPKMGMGIFLKKKSQGEPSSPKSEPSVNLAEAGAQAERTAIHAALSATKYNKTLAARMLGISRNKLYKKIRDLGLNS